MMPAITTHQEDAGVKISDERLHLRRLVGREATFVDLDGVSLRKVKC